MSLTIKKILNSIKDIYSNITNINSSISTINSNITNLQEKNIMTLSLHADFIVQTTNEYLPLSLDFDTKMGNRLVFQNGGIKIGSGVSKILVSAQLTFESKSTRNTHVRIAKNNGSQDNTLGWQYRNFSNGELGNLVISPILVNVQKGDLLNLYYYCAAGDIINGNAFGKRTNMTVMVVE